MTDEDVIEREPLHKADGTAERLPVATMQRLAFIHSLASMGERQARQPEPLAALAVLTFHDSIELFLHLAAEHVDAQRGQLGKNRMLKFEEYFGIINEAMSRNEAMSADRLVHQAAITRLNDARIALKHHGTPTARHAVEQLGAEVTRFFEDNTPLVFGIEYRTISMVNLVTCEPARLSLQKAEDHLADGNTEGAQVATATAFAQLIRDYEQRATSRYGRSPFAFGDTFAFDSSQFRNPSLFYTEQHQFEDRLMKSVQALQEAMKIVGLGIDYRRYTKFRLLTPGVRFGHGPDPVVFKRGGTQAQPPSLEACRFSFDFVIETAIQLQEVDLDRV